jgi:hypothetical protein
MKYLLVLSFTLFSLTSFGSEILNVKDLKVGDRLEGVNNITKRECTIEVLKKEAIKDEQEIVIIVDGKEDEEYRLRYRKGLLTYEYTAQLYDFKDSRLNAIVKAQAVLKTGKISDRTTFRIVQEVYYENHFVLNTLVNCLKLKEA